MNTHWRNWCWSWSSSTLAIWCKKPTHWKGPWWWERLKAGEDGDSQGWDGWMATPTQWTWVWSSSGRWWRTEKPGVLQSMRLQRARHDWETEQENEHSGKKKWKWSDMRWEKIALDRLERVLENKARRLDYLPPTGMESHQRSLSKIIMSLDLKKLFKLLWRDLTID